MTFSEVLNNFMSEYGINAKELSKLSNLSESTISRYKRGVKEPKRNSNAVSQLATAISSCNTCKKSYYDIMASLNDSVKSESFDFDNMTKKLNILINTLDINARNLSHYLKYDASYLSRIRSGKRHPSNASQFCNGVAEYVTKHYGSTDGKLLANLIGCSEKEIKNSTSCKNAIFKWITDNEAVADNTIEQFLTQLDSFDLKEFINTSSNKSDLGLLESIIINPDTDEYYYSIPEFKLAELKIIKSVLISESNSDMFYYNDMPFEKLAQDNTFAINWTSGICAILKKGVKIKIIHNIHRSLYEMMLGLRGWIPLYMTGLVAPYYFKDMSDPVFNHLLVTSGNSALSGEAVCNHHENARYHFTTKRDEISYYKKRADDMLSKAKPLMEIYTVRNANDYVKCLNNYFSSNNEVLHNINTAPPVYTLSDELLEKILVRNNICEEACKRIFDYVNSYRGSVEKQLSKGCKICDELTIVDEAAYDEMPVSLAFADIFLDTEIKYSYEEYREHIRLSNEFALSNKTYQFMPCENEFFSNIQIRIIENNYVIISKSKSPAIHFVIKHPKLRYAIEQIDLR